MEDDYVVLTNPRPLLAAITWHFDYAMVPAFVSLS